MVTISESFGQTILNVYGSKGRAWLTELPKLVATFAERWSLEVAAPFPNLTYGYVVPATCADGRPAVLKASPGSEIVNEIAALRFYESQGAVTVLNTDPKARVFLMERLNPGRTLFDEVKDDGIATRIAARTMRKLWAPAPKQHNFPTVASWSKGFERLRSAHEGTTGPLPEKLVALSETYFRELLSDSAPSVVLHGDLHHWNILSACPENWIAIDPKGVVGEPAYEVGAWMRNPVTDLFSSSNLTRIMDRRLDILVEETGLDRERMKRWSLAQAVLSACWSIEDNETGWQPMLELAKTLQLCR